MAVLDPLTGDLDEQLLALLDRSTPEEIAALVDGLPPDVVDHLLSRLGTTGSSLPAGPAEQAAELDPAFRARPHLAYLSGRVAQAVADVEAGQNRMLVVSMPPRAGKSTLLSLYSPLWMLRKHPDWKVILTSYDGALAGDWARQVRSLIEEHPSLGIKLAADSGAGSSWRTADRGSMFATSLRGSMTGRGAKVLIIDDPTKDFVEAHSALVRQNVWNWWLSVVQTRLEGPYLVIAVQTRWHTDDLVGRLLSDEHEGDPARWERIELPAIAEAGDVLGRERGEPLLTPLLDETPAEAVARWDEVKRSVGTYVFSAMYQQSPAPAKGAVFDVAWWRYWTRDPDKATEDGRVVYLEPSLMLGARWLDSWDMAFKATTDSDFVVGQRWARLGGNRYLVAQQRGRWSFTQSIARMEAWAVADNPGTSPCGHLVHQRLVEDKANGTAILDVLHDKIAGLKAINPTTSKEARARAVTPEVESGNVYLPLPSDPGNEWVLDVLSELRNFPYDAHDDTVDALTQALTELRDGGVGSITVPRQARPAAPTSVAALARTAGRRRR